MNGTSRIRWALNCATWNPSKEEWLFACSCIQKEEKERILRFVHAKNAKHSMGGRLLARKALMQLLKLPNNAINLARNDKGKPVLVDIHDGSHDQKVQFNVSHDGQYVVLAAEWDRKVGVDIMQITRPVGTTSVKHFFHQMKRQFSEREWEQILQCQNEQQQLSTFFRLWCLKESYIKAIGTGIGMGLQRLEFELSPLSWRQQVETGTAMTLDGVMMNDWTFEESLIDKEHCVCVALSDKQPVDHAPLFHQVTFGDTLTSLDPTNITNQTDWEILMTKL